MNNFKELKVWQKAHDLTLEVYRLTKSFPKSEDFALTSQMRRAAMSIPANIVEGCGRRTPSEFANCLGYAQGSSTELESFLLLTKDLNYAEKDGLKQMQDRLIEIQKMLSGLIRKLHTDT